MKGPLAAFNMLQNINWKTSKVHLATIIVVLFFVPEFYNDVVIPYVVNVVEPGGGVGVYFRTVISIEILVMFVVYPLYPRPYSPWKYYSRIGFENLVFEYEYLKRIVYVILSISIILYVFSYSLPFIAANYDTLVYHTPGLRFTADILEATYSIWGNPGPTISIINVFQILFNFIIYSAILRIVLLASNKQLRFAFAFGCIIISLNKQNEIDKTRYLNMGLKKYNKYLQKYTQLQIKDIDTLYSRISFITKEEKDRIIQLLCKSFGDSELQPIRSISKYFSLEEAGQVLIKETKEPLRETIKGWTLFFVAVIPVALTIIQFILKSAK
jgi:hypothetical protein